MDVDDGLGDGQPQAGALAISLPAAVGSIEAIEEARQMVCRDVRAGIFNHDLDAAGDGLRYAHCGGWRY